MKAETAALYEKRTAQTFLYNPYSRWEDAEIWNLILYRHKSIPKPAEIANETVRARRSWLRAADACMNRLL